MSEVGDENEAITMSDKKIKKTVSIRLCSCYLKVLLHLPTIINISKLLSISIAPIFPELSVPIDTIICAIS